LALLTLASAGFADERQKGANREEGTIQIGGLFSIFSFLFSPIPDLRLSAFIGGERRFPLFSRRPGGGGYLRQVEGLHRKAALQSSSPAKGRERKKALLR
jgi:hypothetical protein